MFRSLSKKHNYPNTIKSHQHVYGNILVGLSFLALTFLTVKTFAPDIKSNAETQNISETVGPYTMSISTDSLTSINITPTSSQAVYTGTSAISYTNNCPHGMNVTMSSASENTSLTRTGTDSGIKTIPTISSGTALADNTWGFSKDNGSTYNTIPALANPATIIDTTSATTTAATLNLIYGVKTDNQLPSGSYSNDIVYTVSAKQQCLSYGITWNLDGGTAATGVTYPSSQSFGSTLDLTSLTPTREGYEFTGWSNGTNTFDGTETDVDINPNSLASLTMTAQWEEKPTMQNFSCSSLSPGDSITLTDSRDGNTYVVKKLADGKCWMTENLRIADKTITPGDSDVYSNFTVTDAESIHLDSVNGGYYDYNTATAGSVDTLTNGEAPASICPKGWHLPTGEESLNANNDFGGLLLAYGFTSTSAYNDENSEQLVTGDPNFNVPGFYYGNTIYTDSGYWWGSTVSNNTPYSLSIDDMTEYNRGYMVQIGSRGGNISGSVRCVANTLNYTATVMLDAGEGTVSKTVIKAVDGLTLDLPIPIRKYWDFDGWYSSDEVKVPEDRTNWSSDETFYAHWSQTPFPDSLTTMQGMTNSICSPVTIGQAKNLIDIRDNKTYTVKKLADGKCWMTENLRLINKTISSADSNLPSGSTWTIPASSVSGFNSFNTNNAYLDNTYGGYYTFYTATAGWGTYSVTSGNASKDICPKGWRLPTGGSSGEFKTLYNNYKSLALMQGDPGFTLSGSVNNGSVYNQGSYGYYWSSTVYTTDAAHVLSLKSSEINSVSSIMKHQGFSVRCVAI